MSVPFTREDMVDAIATAITDSMGPDWNSHMGAESVVSNCGVFELYEAAEALDRFWLEGFCPPGDDDVPRLLSEETLAVWKAIRAALAKARGESQQ